MTSSDLWLLLPTIVLATGGALLVLSEPFLIAADRRYQAPLAFVTTAVAFALALAQLKGIASPAERFGGAAREDAFGAFIAVTVCGGLALTVLYSAGYLRRRGVERGEYYGLLLFAAAGMVLLALSADLVMIFVALETMSLSTYALVAFLRKGQRPSEAAFKYFVLGAFSSALYLYGAALAYGVAGSTRLSALVQTPPGSGLLLAAAQAFLLAGFAFKVAAVPFHMWAPDVYEGAPTPVTAFMAVGVKAAAFAAFFRTIAGAFAQSPERWQPMVLWLAVLTMALGNLVALPQRNVKRMLAYSSIAHAGYALIALSASGVAASRVLAGESLLFYLAAYTVSAVGAFGLAAAVERKDPDAPNAWDLDRFAGLARRRPMLALFMAIFMLSLAGIPPTAGFMAKLFVLRAALDAGQVGLAIVGVATSAVGAYYYLRVVVYMYFRAPEASGEPEESAASLDWGLAIACALVFVLGIGTGGFTDAARRGAEQLFTR